ncbi:hypothetical protein PGT21_050317 [Puccinia graminis f. sp. tritici]|uniref:Uncharacterized protein n=1 Tax=Puccinia graminis f. sp. tritici TaxID=56615 RepID=A0A5B0M5D1_PUCGR|nr:hypothetical protein PGT21_050317 [Puccinia graminis f. sp. tritici]
MATVFWLITPTLSVFNGYCPTFSILTSVVFLCTFHFTEFLSWQRVSTFSLFITHCCCHDLNSIGSTGKAFDITTRSHISCHESHQKATYNFPGGH